MTHASRKTTLTLTKATFVMIGDFILMFVLFCSDMSVEDIFARISFAQDNFRRYARAFVGSFGILVLLLVLGSVFLLVAFFKWRYFAGWSGQALADDGRIAA
jgi:hypothetical protein